MNSDIRDVIAILVPILGIYGLFAIGIIGSGHHTKATAPHKVTTAWRYGDNIAETDMTLRKFASDYSVPAESLLVWNKLPKGYNMVKKGTELHTSHYLDLDYGSAEKNVNNEGY